ncbi:MAG TPA: amino acid adenylation domain-containing protein, partial [Pyrinomonadaceae bacterium]|nr:amino acid adenylation domain-containing protein [Pyrinomonadaceae bacterium]
ANGDQRLVCYLVSSDETRLLVGELRDYMKIRLPDYMVPSIFVMLDQLPLTVSGKLDRHALPATDGNRPELQAIYTPPRTSIEEMLAGIWSQVLGVDRIGVFDNFFELGGDSIRSVQILARTQERGLTFSLQDLFQHQTIDELARLQPNLDAPSLALTVSEPFCLLSMQDRARLSSDVEDAYPLTMLQAGMIFHTEFRADLYHSIISFRLRATVDLNALQTALRQLSSSHPILRTSFDLSTYGEPLQLVHKDGGAQLDYEDLRHLVPAEQDQVIKDWINTEKTRNFDWTNASLMRFQIHQLGEDLCEFSFSAPHALLDGWSDGLLLTQLFNRYFSLQNQTDEPLDPVPTALFRDYVALERQSLESEEVQQFWANQSSESTFARLALWNQSEATGTEPAHHLEVLVSGEGLEGLKRLARLAAVPLKSVLLAAHLRIMSVISGQQDVVTGLLSNGREEKVDGERVVGLFLNTLPFRMKVSGGEWIDLVRETFETEWKMLPYRRYPLMQMQRNNGGQPLFETIFNYTHFHVYDSIQNQEQVNVLGSAGVSETNFTIVANFSLNLDQSSLRLRLSSDLGKLNRGQAESIGSYYRETLESMAKAPYARYEQQSVMSEADRHRWLVEWNATETNDRLDTLVPQVFERQVRRTPDRPAVLEGGQRLNYKELNQRANQLARRLKKLGIGPERAVAVCMERGIDMVVAMLAIFKAGGAYVPLDPTYPTERLAFMLEDTAAMALLTHARWVGLFLDQQRVICVDSERDMIGQEDDRDLPIAPLGQDLAYIIYTSGSTGLPKGAMITHRGMLNHLWAKVHDLQISLTDIAAQTASQSFDISVWQFLAVLLVGGRVRIVDDETGHHPGQLLKQIREAGITILETVPSLLRVMLEEIRSEAAVFEMPSLRWLIVTGEALPPELCRQWTLAYPQVPMMNAYGPTECADDVTHYIIDRTPTTDLARIPIGKPVANTQLYVLDQHLFPAPTGVAGELCAGGAGVARGYLNNPSKTAELFIPDPFGESFGARLYRTGDLVRHLPDGNLEFLYRIDRQVKIRGYRVEVREVETVLAAHPDVAECVVLSREGEAGELGLVAYVIAAPGHQTPGIGDLRAYLQRKLPVYMIPTGWSFLDELPLTTDGKLDLNGLSAPEYLRLESAYAPPRTPVEELLSGMWQDLLSVPVSIHDNFFELGGHSLLATQLIMRVRTVFAVALPLRTLFEQPTIADLSDWIEKALRLGQGLETPPIVKVARDGELPLSFAQQRLWFLDHLRPGQSFYNIPIAIELLGRLDRAALERTLNEIVRRHEVLRTSFASEGGVARQIIAAEMELVLEVIELGELGAAERERETRRLAREEGRRPFDLSAGPLLRVKLLQLGAEEQVVLMTMHHIVSDGWSMGVLIAEVAALYEAYREGRESPLPELGIQYGDFAVWQRGWLQGEVLEQQL